MTDELLLCPFCGNAPFDRPIEQFGIFWVHCPHCDADGPDGETKERAVALWNTRAQHGDETT